MTIEPSNFTIHKNFYADNSNVVGSKNIYLHYSDTTLTLNTNPNDAIEVPVSLSTYQSIDWLDAFIKGKRVKSIIIDKVLEQVRDIRPLLAFLRTYSLKHSINIVFIFSKENSTPARRYWNSSSRDKLIFYCGFKVKSKDTNSASYTVFCEENYYNDFLKEANLPNYDFSYLIVTTEHSDYRITGGIGSYVKECQKLYGAASAALIIDNNTDIDTEKIKDNRWFSAQQLIGKNRFKQLDNSNFDMISAIVYECIAQIIFYYPRITTIESQEALLDRAIQAKQSLLIPKSINLVTTCHGASFHLARAKNDMLELEQIHVAYREKRTIEDSDVTVFPTNFLKESYKKVGVEGLDGNNKIIKRLPFDLSRLPQGKSLVDYRRIIYVGKTTSIKGFDIFLNTLINLAAEHPEVAQKIEAVTCIVTSTGIIEKPIARLYTKAQALFNIEIISLNREDLLHFLAESAEDSIALVTYPGDNHPTVILELMAIGHDFLALNCGGTPELIPKNNEQEYIVHNNHDDIIQAVARCFANPKKRSILINQLSVDYKKQQMFINKEYSVTYFNRFNSGNNIYIDNPKVQIIVAGSAESKEYQKTIESIKHQTYNNIIISNAAKQNADYCMRLKEGDILDEECIALLAAATQIGDVSAVMCNQTVPVYENYKYKATEEFDPVPPQLGSIFLQEKYKRRVVALFKASDIPDFNALHNDWELVIALSSRNKRINIVPENLITVRRIDSDISWDHQSIQDSMASLLTQISKFDTYILYAQLKRLDDLYFGSKLYNHLEDMYIRRDDPSIMHGVTPNTVKMVGAYRRYMPKPAHKLIMGSAKTIHKVGRKIKRS